MSGLGLGRGCVVFVFLGFFLVKKVLFSSFDCESIECAQFLLVKASIGDVCYGFRKRLKRRSRF